MWLREFTQKGQRYRYVLRSVREGRRVRQEVVAAVTGMCGLFDGTNDRYLFFRPLIGSKRHCLRCPLESVPYPETNQHKRKPLDQRLQKEELERCQRPEWEPPCYKKRGAVRLRGEASAWRLSSTDPVPAVHPRKRRADRR